MTAQQPPGATNTGWSVTVDGSDHSSPHKATQGENVPKIGDPALVDYAGDQANARRALQARIDAALEIHKPKGIYCDCECFPPHRYTQDDDLEPGVVEIDDIGLTCGHMYDICGECHTDNHGDQAEWAANNWPADGTAWPCATAQAIAIEVVTGD